MPWWFWAILVILGLYYLRFYQPQVYAPIMELVDNTVKALFNLIGGLFGGISLPSLTNMTGVQNVTV